MIEPLNKEDFKDLNIRTSVEIDMKMDNAPKEPDFVISLLTTDYKKLETLTIMFSNHYYNDDLHDFSYSYYHPFTQSKKEEIAKTTREMINLLKSSKYYSASLILYLRKGYYVNNIPVLYLDFEYNGKRDE